MARVRNLLLFFLILTVASLTCTKKGTNPQEAYREPLAFDIYATFEDVPMDGNYVNKVYDTWNGLLKYDATIKNNTWLVGDYKVFVYFHAYICGMLDTRYDEVVFFTTTKPKKGTDKIHSTITVFEAEVSDSVISLSGVETYVYLDIYRPIKGEEHARNIMMNYVEEYSPCGGYLLDMLKYGLQKECYIRDWGDHYVYQKFPTDFGGAIIVNKLSSKLDFLGSSVFMGHGKRHFPPNECAQ